MDCDSRELIMLLSWAFEEAEKWLFESRGTALDDPKAHRAREILSNNGMYGNDKNWRIKLSEEGSGKT